MQVSFGFWMLFHGQESALFSSAPEQNARQFRLEVGIS